MSATHEVPEPDWPLPPDGGWTADDLDRLPSLPPHTQLIDACLVFPCRQSVFHEHATSVFGRQLYSAAPSGLEVLCRFTMDIDRQNRPEPDVIVARAEALVSLDQTRLPAAAVVLAVEVVMPDSASRDRETKPLKYARAGIPHCWRVENENGRAAVHTFELEPTTGTYTGVGIFRERMRLTAPFPVELDLTQSRHVAPGTSSSPAASQRPGTPSQGNRAAAVQARRVSARTPPPCSPDPGSTAAPHPAPA